MAQPLNKGLKVAGSAAGMGLTALTLALATPFVAGLEGRSLIAYLDSGGVPTICNGETKGVQLGQTRTDAQCDALLAGSLGKALRTVDASVKIPLSPYQRAGLASFTYNVGDSAFKKSTVLKRLNSARLKEACNGILNWVWVKGKDCRLAKSNCRGIVRRRQKERELCLKVDNNQ